MPVFIKASGGGYVCDQISNLAAQVGFATAGTAVLTWTKPTDANFKGLVVRYKTGGYPTGPTDGTNAYDSNDAVPVSTITVSGLTDGTLYYFRAFAYCYEGATRVYNDQTTGAQISATPLQLKGSQTFTSSGTFSVPAGVTKIDVFLVGGGSGGGAGFYASRSYTAGGGGGGYTATYKNLAVTPSSTCAVTIGSGGAGGIASTSDGVIGNAGGSSGITINGETKSVNGGGAQAGFQCGAAGGSGGGGGADSTWGTSGGAGGSNGANGVTSKDFVGGTGQGTTTRAFGETTGALYSGGGGGGNYNAAPNAGGDGGGGAGGYTINTVNVKGIAGTANTGGGGGGGAGGYYGQNPSGGSGGSGVVIIRWGY